MEDVQEVEENTQQETESQESSEEEPDDEGSVEAEEIEESDESEPSTETASVDGGPSIDESYDSDFDPETEESAAELGKLLQQMTALKDQSVDGQGFIYVFSDESNENVHRLKVGASRFPDKRLQQAKSFNTEIKLVSAVAVDLRKQALTELQESLSQYQLNGNAGWYRAALGQVLEIVSNIATKYPSEQSDC